jgi:hypothetical protein
VSPEDLLVTGPVDKFFAGRVGAALLDVQRLEARIEAVEGDFPARDQVLEPEQCRPRQAVAIVVAVRSLDDAQHRPEIALADRHWRRHRYLPSTTRRYSR